MRVVMLGTLREDVVFFHDFSSPMTSPEIIVREYIRRLGGSVFNTTVFLSRSCSDDIITLCIPFHEILVREFEASIVNDAVRLLHPDEPILEYPMTIIGVMDNSDKQMISFDPLLSDNNHVLLFAEASLSADIVYTSLYEINAANCEIVAETLSSVRERGKESILDLAPNISGIALSLLLAILPSVTVLIGNVTECDSLLRLLGLSHDYEELLLRFCNLKMVFVTEGMAGASVYMRANGEVHRYETHLHESVMVKNSTGAGDVFSATVILGLLREYPVNLILEEAVIQSREYIREVSK